MTLICQHLLLTLCIRSLDARRSYALLVILFGFVNGVLDCGELLCLMTINAPYRNTRNSELFYIPFHRTIIPIAPLSQG